MKHNNARNYKLQNMQILSRMWFRLSCMEWKMMTGSTIETLLVGPMKVETLHGVCG